MNVALLTFAGDRHDPVGRLSPVASLPAPASPAPALHAREREDD